MKSSSSARNPEFYSGFMYSAMVTFLMLAVTGVAVASEAPKRKSGLWEISMVMEGLPNMGAVQQCIDQTTDNLMQQQEKKAKADCSVMDMKQQGDKITMHSVCKYGESTATTDAVFLGSFDTAYKGDINTTYNPPLHGRSSTKMQVEAKWLSACKPGQKPGDVIMPNMKGMNLNDMMNDPKFQEMMKKQK